jgi:hypothetical protein
MKIVEMRGYDEPRTLLRFACRSEDAADDLVSLLVEIGAELFPDCRASTASEIAECRR